MQDWDEMGVLGALGQFGVWMKLQGAVLLLVMSPRNPLLGMTGIKMDFVSSQQFLCGQMLRCRSFKTGADWVTVGAGECSVMKTGED